MKNIEVSDEMYEALMELSKEMVSQDPRCTAMPHLFQIQTEQQIPAYDGCGEEKWVDGDGGELNSEEEEIDHIADHIFDTELDDKMEELTKEAAKEKAEKWTKEEREVFLRGQDWHDVEVNTQMVYQNCFFTAKACEDHIERNDYHYNTPTVYLNHGWRNPEMELVSKFLCEISGGKVHK